MFQVSLLNKKKKVHIITLIITMSVLFPGPHQAVHLKQSDAKIRQTDNEVHLRFHRLTTPAVAPRDFAVTIRILPIISDSITAVEIVNCRRFQVTSLIVFPMFPPKIRL